MPHMAEDAWLSLPYTAPAPSVFQAGWAVPDAQWSSLTADEAALWGAMAEVRTAVNTVLERARSDKAIGAGLEAKVRRALKRWPSERPRATLACSNAASGHGPIMQPLHAAWTPQP